MRFLCFDHQLSLFPSPRDFPVHSKNMPRRTKSLLFSNSMEFEGNTSLVPAHDSHSRPVVSARPAYNLDASPGLRRHKYDLMPALVSTATQVSRTLELVATRSTLNGHLRSSPTPTHSSLAPWSSACTLEARSCCSRRLEREKLAQAQERETGTSSSPWVFHCLPQADKKQKKLS